jgi:hypothetical protein
VAVLGGLGAFLVSGNDAMAESAGCALLRGGDFSFPNINGGPFSRTETYVLEAGETVTITWANVTSLTLTIGGTTVVNVPPPATGSTTYTVPTSGPLTYNKTVSGPANASVTLTCTAAAATPATNSEAADTGGALFQQLAAAAPDTSPAGLPGSEPVSDEETPAEKAVRECRAGIANLEKELAAKQDELREAENSIKLAEQFSDGAAIKLARGNRLKIRGEIREIERKLRQARIDCEKKQQALDYERGDDLPPGPDPIFYNSNKRIAQAHSPWQAMGYGPEPTTTINFSRESGFAVGGMPVNLWARARGSLLSGTLGRSGVAGSLQLGAVFGVTGNLDLGFYAHILAGNVTSSTLGARLDTFAGGVGGYAKFKVGERGEIGISAGHEWGGNTITIGTTTGFFTSSKWSVDASAAVPFNVNGMTVTPMLLASFRQITLGAYTNSANVAVPASTDSTFALSAAVDVARTIPTSGTVIVSVTPRFTARGNFYLKRAATLTPAAGITLQGNAFTLDLNGGLALALATGGSVDVAIGAVGIFGTAQAYNLRLGLRLPIN